MSDRVELLIVGGGPAGHAAADAYRAAGGEGSVAIVADEERIAYQRPLLSKELLRGELEESELPLEDEGWLAAHDVRLIAGRAVALDADARTVALSGGRTLGWAQCLLATGAEPKRLPIPGADDPGVRVLRSLDHLRELRARLSGGAPVAVIGSGFIGCEIAASLRILGHPVTLVSDEPAPNAARLGDTVAARIAGWLEDAGVELRLGAEVERIERDDGGFAVHAGERSARGAVVVMATGVAPRSELARAAGAQLAEDGAVHADAALRTLARRRARGRRRRARPQRDGGTRAARRALGRCARAGRGRRARRGWTGGAVGRRARLLVDDRRAHAQARRLGRRLRRRARRGPRRRRLRRLVWRARSHRRRARARRRRRLRARPRAGRRRGAVAMSAPLAAIVVVPARDEQRRIGGCLEALAAQQLPGGERFAIVVVLDGCRDETGRVATRVAAALALDVQLLDGPGRGSGPARRVGMEAAASRLLAAGRPDGLIASTDADTRPQPDWLARQLAHVRDGAAAIGGLVELDARELAALPNGVAHRRAAQASVRLAQVRTREPLAEHHHFAGASIGVTAQTYRAVGGLEPLHALEDEAFATRLRAHGVAIARPADVRVRTSARSSGRAARGLALDLDLAAWAERRRCDAADFDLATLQAAKGATTVSVIVPAKEVAETIGAVLAQTVAPLADVGLVDELVVVDAGSADGTAAVAAAAGACVLQQDELLAEHGPALGKGDAMWRALHATSGDVVCFLDADTVDPVEAHLRGLLGPLLADPAVMLAKGAFERPWNGTPCARGRARDRVDGAAAAEPPRPAPGRLRAAAGRRVRGPPRALRADPLSDRLRGRDRRPHRRAAPVRTRRARRGPARHAPEPPPAAACARRDGLCRARRGRAARRPGPQRRRRSLPATVARRRSRPRPGRRASPCARRPQHKEHAMADLTILESKLAEVLGLSMAAQAATKHVLGLLEDGDEELRETLERMHAEEQETEERCTEVAGNFDGKKTAIIEAARETRDEGKRMLETYLGGEDDPLEGFEFLTMAEAGEVGHWSIVEKLNERARDEHVAELTAWALPVQRRHLGEVLEGSVELAGAKDPDELDE